MSTVGDNLHSLECGFGKKQRHDIEPNTGSMPRKGQGDALGTSTVPPCAPEPGGPGGSWHSHSIVQVKNPLVGLPAGSYPDATVFFNEDDHGLDFTTRWSIEQLEYEGAALLMIAARGRV